MISLSQRADGEPKLNQLAALPTLDAAKRVQARAITLRLAVLCLCVTRRQNPARTGRLR